MSLPSYKDYPVHRPFINTLVHHTAQTRTHQPGRLSSPGKAFPETNSAGKFNLCICVCVVCFPFTKFPFRDCGVSELHGYTCNMMLDYLNVSAGLTCIHSFTLSFLGLLYILPTTSSTLKSNYCSCSHDLSMLYIHHVHISDLSLYTMCVHVQRSYLAWGACRRRSGGWSWRKDMQSSGSVLWGEMHHTLISRVRTPHRNTWITKQIQRER